MNNSAAIGYMILAAKQLNLDNKIIRKLEETMYRKMDVVTEEEAEKVYRNFWKGFLDICVEI